MGVSGQIVMGWIDGRTLKQKVSVYAPVVRGTTSVTAVFKTNGCFRKKNMKDWKYLEIKLGFNLKSSFHAEKRGQRRREGNYIQRCLSRVMI